MGAPRGGSDPRWKISDHSGDSLGKPADAPVGATDTGIRWFRLQIEVICDSDESFTGFVRVSGPLELFPPNFGSEQSAFVTTASRSSPKAAGRRCTGSCGHGPDLTCRGSRNFPTTPEISLQTAPGSIVTGRESSFPERLPNRSSSGPAASALSPAGFQTEKASSYSDAS